jgi:hypothetical protein
VSKQIKDTMRCRAQVYDGRGEGNELSDGAADLQILESTIGGNICLGVTVGETRTFLTFSLPRLVKLAMNFPQSGDKP